MAVTSLPVNPGPEARRYEVELRGLLHPGLPFFAIALLPLFWALGLSGRIAVPLSPDEAALEARLEASRAEVVFRFAGDELLAVAPQPGREPHPLARRPGLPPSRAPRHGPGRRSRRDGAHEPLALPVRPRRRPGAGSRFSGSGRVCLAHGVRTTLGPGGIHDSELSQGDRHFPGGTAPHLHARIPAAAPMRSRGLGDFLDSTHGGTCDRAMMAAASRALQRSQTG